MSCPQTGVLLVNLGTPDAPKSPEVRRYLREFLGDGRVIDINPVGRWALVNLIIAPFRAPQSARAYRSIWTEAGSPLLVHGEAFRAAVEAALEIPVALAMRYGSPSIPAKLEQLREQGCDRILLFPLYPQFASSTTGSSIEATYRAACEAWNIPLIDVVPPFFDDPAFIDAQAAVGRPPLESFAPDRVLFSFHGLPVRHIQKADPSGQHCLVREDCCDRITDRNRNCYRAQCFATARAIADRLDLGDRHQVAFQSRLGRADWIRPYTDEVVRELAEQGIRRLAAYCPAFVADCLETLEEIGIRAREAFIAAGGEDLALIPSLNTHPAWVEAATTLIRRAL